MMNSLHIQFPIRKSRETTERTGGRVLRRWRGFALRQAVITVIAASGQRPDENSHFHSVCLTIQHSALAVGVPDDLTMTLPDH